MSQTIVMITPENHGQRMSLEEFAEAEGQEGYLYELSRGVVQVVQIANLPHGNVVDNIYGQVWRYRNQQPQRIQYIATGSSCKLLLPGMESERHPDLAVYLTEPPQVEPVWQYWIPEIVIEVVSPRQEKRDYEEKRDEYLAAGVKEYWIVDPASKRFLVLRRRGDQWQELPLDFTGTYHSSLLREFELILDEVMAAYRKTER